MTVESMRGKEDPEEFRSRMYKCYRVGLGSGAPSDDYAVRAPYLRRLIRTQFPSDREARILDLGCGSGILLRCLQEAGYRKLAGVDISPVQVDAVLPDLGGEIIQGDLFEVLSGAESGSFDVLVAFDVIEHLGKSELLELADEALRVLKPGGRWIVHAPNAAGFFGGRVRYADLTHEQAFTRESLEQLLRASGFGEATFFEDRPVVHGIASAFRWLVWMALRSTLRVCWAAETGSTGKECIFSQNILSVAVKL